MRYNNFKASSQNRKANYRHDWMVLMIVKPDHKADQERFDSLLSKPKLKFLNRVSCKIIEPRP